MKKLLFILGIFFVFKIYAVSESELVITCPKILLCTPSDGPKKNQDYARVNQEAYECFQKHGELDLAKKAAYEQTHCLTVYGFTNATINGQSLD